MIDPISGKYPFRTLEPDRWRTTERLMELQYRKGFFERLQGRSDGETNPEKVYKIRLKSQTKRTTGGTSHNGEICRAVFGSSPGD